MDITFIHLALGICLFFIINWIGKHSYSIGYMEISMFVKSEEAPALNFLIRVLTPIVYIILSATALYSLKLDKYVTNIYLVNIYYITFRLLFNLVTNRGLLLNWYRQALYWLAIIIISYITYDKIIRVKKNILPDFTTIANELWIIILIFLFQIANKIRLSEEKTIIRKDRYLNSRYIHLTKLYNDVIEELTNEKITQTIIYSILIYEDFNRPKIIRIIEYIYHKIQNKPHTLGIMQVHTNEKISDLESVIRGSQIVINARKEFIEHLNEDEFYEFSMIYFILEKYNGSYSYRDEVSTIYEKLKEISNVTIDSQISAASFRNTTS